MSSPVAQRRDAAELAGQVLDGEARREADQAREGTGPPSVVTRGPATPIARQLPWGTVLATGGVSLLSVLALLNFFDNFDSTAFFVLGPNIQRSLHLSNTGLGAIGGLGAILLVTAAIPLGYAADRRRRTWLAGGAAAVAAAATLATGAVQSIWQLALARLVVGAGKSSTGPVHNSLLADGYPIAGRARVFAVHNLALPLSALLAPVIAGAVAAAAGGPGGWRWAFLIPGAAVAVLAIVVVFVREPGRGRFEQEALAGAGGPAEGSGRVPATQQPEPIPFAAGRQRLLKTRTLYYLLLGIGVLGFALVGVPEFFNKLLQVSYHYGPLRRGIVGSLTNVGGLAGVVGGGVLGDRLFRASPPRLVAFTAAVIGAFGVVFAGSLYLPTIGLVLVGVAISIGLIYAAIVPVYSLVAAVVPPRLRALGFALVGIYVFLLGGFLGGVLIGALSSAWGVRTALAVVTPAAALVAAALVSLGARHVRADIARVSEEIEEEAVELARRVAGVAEPPVLQVRNLDFSYGPIQVLFDVTLDVHRGEVLALLGTNGAGKSTLLRVISGLARPDRGVVRFQGRPITLAPAEDRAAQGIVQMPCGRAVFPSLSVRENLLAGAYQFIWDTARVQRRTDRVLGMFPRLGERLEQPAGSLSGGEQQMLALAKALLLDPTVLLIDELSLGLAPVMVQELLAQLAALRAEGLTIVIVEQSVNVALAVADRAVFMEKGRIRFSGPAHELVGRDDLVRAVFLGAGGGG